ncbi:MAG: hypothetical protein IKR74_00570 [Bacilli bacterium]|nr:hypothetical protein [Bacilli bacterium]
MSRVRAHNSFATKIFTIIFIIAFVAGIIYLCFVVLTKEKNNNIFDLGVVDSNVAYTDKIVNSYDDFKELISMYNVTFQASEEDFKTNSFLFLFQDYNPCSESKPKTIEDVSIEDNITITYKVHSMCGWCQKHMVLYILKIDLVEENKNIEYKYIFPSSQVDCGTVS